MMKLVSLLLQASHGLGMVEVVQQVSIVYTGALALRAGNKPESANQG